MTRPNAPYPLEPSGADMRRMVEVAMERIVAHIESLPQQPAHDLDDAPALARALAEPMPESGGDLEDMLALLFDRAVPKSFNTAGPGYLAYIPGGGLFHSAVADLIACAVNRYTGVWLAAPLLVQLELNVLRWFNDLVGYPRSAGGILTSGGSLANFSAIVAARRAKLPEAFLDGRIYVSDQVHHSVAKAAMLAGFPPHAVRVVASDNAFRLDLQALARAIAEDRAKGATPFLLVGSAGTTNTGAVDDFPRLADVAAAENLWLHADAAYGGFFVLTERGRKVLRGMDRADSITLDPHKGLFLPYGTGCLLVRDATTLRRAHELHAEYLPEMRDGEEFVDFCQMSPELSRDFRGLRVWLPFKLLGAGAFRASLDEKLDLARWAAQRLRELPQIEVVTDPELSIVAFRLAPQGAGPDEENRRNREFQDRINARRNVYLTGTTVRGRYLLRLCILSFRTHMGRMERCLEDIRQVLAELATGETAKTT